MTGKVGFFGGTFDPIHFGHLNLAVDLMEAHGLDEVWFCPANFNPKKPPKESTLVHHRLNMVSLAIEGNPRFKLLENESRRIGPSYTLDTLLELTAIENQKPEPKQIYLLLSDETIQDFCNWHKPREIVELTPVLVGSRLINPTGLLKLREQNNDPFIYDAIVKGWTKTKLFEITSTEIRERLRKGLCCRYLIPEKVLDYIYSNQLYYSL